MALGDFIDGLIEPWAPRWATQRQAARIGFAAVRQYDAAGRGRRTKGWRRPSSSADTENANGIVMLRNSAHDLVRNNKYAAAGVRQIVANMIGDGIAVQLTHDDPVVQRTAQDEWKRWAESKVDGNGDFYEHQKLTARGIVVGGETLTAWHADADGPDGRIEGLEGDYLDHSRTGTTTAGGRIVQGVQYDKDRMPSAYWLFTDHPGDLSFGGAAMSAPIAAQHVDHVFERLRFGQTRGVSWLSAVAMTLRDIGDIEDAVRMQQKVQACLGLVLTRDADDLGAGSPLAAQRDGEQRDERGIETLAPGMIVRARPGETVTTIEPSQSGGAVEFIRQQMAAVSANMAPYHLMTGDVSQANYSSLRAAMLGHWALLDDWQQNVIIPHAVRPAVDRRMARLALRTGDKRYLSMKVGYALPVRRFVDPIKDLMGELIEIRAGLKTLSRSLAERGINTEDQLREIKRLNDIIDDLGLALDSDPRRLTDSGVLQIAAGYLAPKGDAQGSKSA
ncbi:phage portal protein [Sphingomonas endophytica]|uniref:Lambda family phage portal protein n=1 Tax=Sphingomonas endophytica TaxID=869719 RepID=A0ABR6N2P0_9SPHN|nr:phage portal protein [Sphingomonas endophytica]MBB5725045.1 lambda family phage portal protein [Sphingomonas endophytica]